MSLPVHANSARGGVYDVGENEALRRIYAKARRAIGERFAVDDEIDRRLAIIVLQTYGAGALPGAEEQAIAQHCVDRLIAKTTAA